MVTQSKTTFFNNTPLKWSSRSKYGLTHYEGKRKSAFATTPPNVRQVPYSIIGTTKFPSAEDIQQPMTLPDLLLLQL